jgi:hypothetical protein
MAKVIEASHTNICRFIPTSNVFQKACDYSGADLRQGKGNFHDVFASLWQLINP